MESHVQHQRSKLTNYATNSNSSFSVNIIIPEELITEILLRLPVKSLLQFKSVSKSWLYLISSPQFFNTHLSVCANNKDYTHHRLIMGFDSQYNVKGCSLSSLLCDSVTKAFEFDFPMKDNRHVHFVGSVNGLICFKIEGKDFLWNPSIRKFKKLPHASALNYLMYGFGYDELHDDYKVVNVFYGLNNHHLGAKIYGLNGDSWLSINKFQRDVVPVEQEGMFLNGKLHWAVISQNGWDIMSIDLADGKWRKVEEPRYGGGDFGFTLCLGLFQGNLSLFCNKWRACTNVWVMKEYGVKESWTKMFTFNRHDIYVVEYPFLPYLWMSNEGEIMCNLRSSFMIYNKKDDSIRYREVINCDFLYDVNIYIESLLWPFSAEGSGDATITEAHLKTIV